jgi:hypothetical protein
MAIEKLKIALIEASALTKIDYSKDVEDIILIINASLTR